MTIDQDKVEKAMTAIIKILNKYDVNSSEGMQIGSAVLISALKKNSDNTIPFEKDFGDLLEKHDCPIRRCVDPDWTTITNETLN
jgi:hypothetical protein